MSITAHKVIDATEMLKSKFKEPTKTEYQRGWNDALQAAYDAGEPKEIQIVFDERAEVFNWLKKPYEGGKT